MSALKENQSSSSKKEEQDYLEKKYGKEPRVTAEELEKMRWSWH